MTNNYDIPQLVLDFRAARDFATNVSDEFAANRKNLSDNLDKVAVLYTEIIRELIPIAEQENTITEGNQHLPPALADINNEGCHD